MARVNVGVNPVYLADQHLIAESVEITMIVGSLRKNNYFIKGFIPYEFKLGKGHINFFKEKIIYLYKRLKEVNKEMLERKFKPGTSIDLDTIPEQFKNDWNITTKDSKIIRNRIIEKINKKDNGFWKYRSKPIDNCILSKMVEENNLFKV